MDSDDGGHKKKQKGKKGQKNEQLDQKQQQQTNEPKPKLVKVEVLYCKSFLCLFKRQSMYLTS
jgi:hypothetical protein